MESVKCKICGARHPMREPCKFGAEAETGALPSASAAMRAERRTPVGDGSLSRVEKSVVVGSNPTSPANLRGQSKRPPTTAGVNDAGKTGVTAGETAPKYDRNQAHRIYMREYMRKRRAKQREALSDGK